MILDADDESYVPLIRKVKATEIVRNGPLCQLFIYLLTDAAYYDRTHTVPVQYGTTTVKLTFGESFINTRELSAYLGIEEWTLRRSMRKLEQRQTITVQKMFGGFKVKLVNAERYWTRWKAECTAAATAPAGMWSPMDTQSESNDVRTSRDNGRGDCHEDVVALSAMVSQPNPQDQSQQRLEAPLRIKEQQQHLEVSSTCLSPKSKDVQSVVGVGAQLDLIAPEPVPMEDHGQELALSAFFAATDEPPFQALQGNVRWLRSILQPDRDVKWVLAELARYYQWWLENPKKRRQNLAASIGNWLRSEERKLTRGHGNNGTRSIKAPAEPGKYDGIGVTFSEFEE